MLNSQVGAQIFGHSSRLSYDKCSYEDEISQSVGPLLYQLRPYQISNCNACLSVFGPRPSAGPRSHGVSTTVGLTQAPSQDLVDVESILSNRNVIASKCKDGKVNDIDVTRFSLQHARICNDFLDPIDTHLTHPPQNYRGMSINRFFNLPRHAQVNIFYDFAINTKLEAKDNYWEKIPQLKHYDHAPPTLHGRNKPCKFNCQFNC